MWSLRTAGKTFVGKACLLCQKAKFKGGNLYFILRPLFRRSFFIVKKKYIERGENQRRESAVTQWSSRNGTFKRAHQDDGPYIYLKEVTR